MDNDKFIKKLLKGTKENKLEWKVASSKKLYNSYQPYYLEKGDKKLVVEKYNTVEYDCFGDEIPVTNCMLSICNDKFDNISAIIEDDLEKSNDLWRLYRLAERQANKIDEIMESFVENIEDVEDY